jgi:hypothetical protein
MTIPFLRRPDMSATLKTAILGAAGFFCANPAIAHGISDADKQAMLAGGYLRYVNLGASHMVTGYDHLLFLFGVIFFLTKFSDIVKFITAFTIGHSITLILATFMQITANYYLVDAVIALTVFYKGFDNVDGFKKYLGMESPNLIKLVFLFGLIHGFGLSTRLQQLPLGDTGLFMRIISFNVGVEVGQIAALTVMLLLLEGWRKTESFGKFSSAANWGLMKAGVLLFLMQMHGFTHDVYADDLAFSRDGHAHAHSTMADVSKPAESELSEPHSHDGGPMHRDVRTEWGAEDDAAGEGSSELHSHDGGPLHRDAPPPPAVKKPKSDHSHGSGAHTH